MIVGSNAMLGRGPYLRTIATLRKGFILTNNELTTPSEAAFRPWAVKLRRGSANDVEPLDAAAVNAVYAQGPQLFGLLRSQFGFIASPVTFWKSQPIPGSTAMQFSPTGLGAALAPINA
jgi:hypothetical protein